MARPGARILGLLLLAVTLLNRPSPVVARSDVDIFTMLVKSYKPEEAPNRYGSRYGNIPVGVQMMLESIVVDEQASAVTLQCLQRLTWSDVRLRYRSAPAAGGLVISHAAAGFLSVPKIWLPSLVYPRALMVDFDNSMDNSFLIRPNGTITWQRRVHLMVPCDINLNSFPWDVNVCRASIRQNLDGEELMLNWTRTAGRPAQAKHHFSINGFHLTSLSATSRTTTISGVAGRSTRSKSLVLRVTFKRQSGYYVINDIIPTSVLVLAAYMTFWLTPEAVVVRTLVTAFMLLACFIVSAIASRAAPLAAVLTALNVWNLVCLFFLLWPLVQSLVVYHMSTRSGGGGSANGGLSAELSKSSTQNGNGGDADHDPEDIVSDVLPPPPPPNDDLGPLPPRPRRRRGPRSGARTMDVTSRAVHPIGFIIVVIVFGVLYS